jgi:hypothetical protein
VIAFLGRNDRSRLPFGISGSYRGEPPLKERPRTIVRRRDLLGLALAAAGAGVASTVAAEPAAAQPIDTKYKRRSRYQPDSGEVRNFYRVNSYPAR